MEKFNKSMIGRKVRFINTKAHEEEPAYYPAVGTIGTVVPIMEDGFGLPWAVLWPKGSVNEWGVEQKNTWFCDEESLELVEEEIDHMTDEEVYEMLMPKMIKNIHADYGEHFWSTIYEITVGANHDTVRAIALAYRSGYGRGKKGRPFKIGGDKSC